MFEAIRINNAAKDDTIINQFLHKKFNLKLRIPYKYKIKITNSTIVSKLSNIDRYVDNNGTNAQLLISDPTSTFLNNEKV